MQTVGAQWLLVGLPNAATLVALVQTADTLPDVLLALPAGALADAFDRRRFLIGLQVFQVMIGVGLTALTLTGQMTPPLLLAFTFALGAAGAVAVPAYQALIPELVPREQLSSAAALGGISVNLARHRSRYRGPADRADRGRRGLRAQHGGLSALRRGAAGLAPSGRGECRSARTVHPGIARGRAVCPLLARRPPAPRAPWHVHPPGQRSVGAASPGRHPAARTGRRRLWSSARRARWRRNSRGAHAPVDASAAIQQPHAPGGRGDLRSGHVCAGHDP